ncbi:hypothetical protein MMK25_34515, partial [Bacillus cereus]|nr:hypothetical protein [Bacillus cereus]
PTTMMTAIAADLTYKLRAYFDPGILIGLLRHSAKYPNDVDLPINEKINQMGFGLTNKQEEILYNDPHEISLILRDNLKKG